MCDWKICAEAYFDRFTQKVVPEKLTGYTVITTNNLDHPIIYALGLMIFDHQLLSHTAQHMRQPG